MWFLVNLLKYIVSVLVDIYHRSIKYCLRRLTNLTELQRVIYGELRGSKRIRNVERSLLESSNHEIGVVLRNLDKAVNEGIFNHRISRKALILRSAHRIAIAKYIKTKLHPRFIIGMTESLECIWAYKDLNIRIELLRSLAFDNTNPAHEAKLLDMWSSLTNGEHLSGRISRQWQNIGFQGLDPATDFRGCGFLALESMSFLARHHTEVAWQLLSHSRHPTYCYPFAVLSIQITFMAFKLFQQGAAKTHFYNRVGLILELDQQAHASDKVAWGDELLGLFFEFCCALMVEFDSYWFANRPKDIMEFGRIKTAFDKKILKKLGDDKACFLVEVRTI